MKYLIIFLIFFAGCKKSDIQPEKFKIDKGKADSVYASKFINDKLK